MNPDDPWPPLGGVTDQEAACASCGWMGTGTMATAPASGADPFGAACPRCGEPVRLDPPSADEVRAARGRPPG